MYSPVLINHAVSADCKTRLIFCAKLAMARQQRKCRHAAIYERRQSILLRFSARQNVRRCVHKVRNLPAQTISQPFAFATTQYVIALDAEEYDCINCGDHRESKQERLPAKFQRRERSDAGSSVTNQSGASSTRLRLIDCQNDGANPERASTTRMRSKLLPRPRPPNSQSRESSRIATGSSTGTF